MFICGKPLDQLLPDINKYYALKQKDIYTSLKIAWKWYFDQKNWYSFSKSPLLSKVYQRYTTRENFGQLLDGLERWQV